MLLLTVAASTKAAAQYPLTPSPALDFTRLSPTLRFSGYVAARDVMRSDTNTISVARARFGLEAQPMRIAAVRVQADFAAIGRTVADTVPPFALTDAFIQLSPPESSTYYARFRPALLVGQFKMPFSLEYLTPFSALRTVNRSVIVDRHAARREIGAMGQVQAWNRVILAGAVANGEGQNRPVNANADEMLLGRLTVVPPFVGSLAAAAKVLAHGGDHRWGADVRWIVDPPGVPGSFVAEGELIRRAAASAGADLDASGGYALGSWRLLPWVEPVVKWERLRETRTTAASTAQSRLTWTTYGLTLHSPDDRERLRAQLNWITRTERPVDAANELSAQLILQF